MTGMSNSRMKRLRLSGSVVFDTCSAETTVPWITSRSSSAARIAGASDSVRCGRHRGGGRDAGLLHLADAGRHQLGDDRLLVHLLHPGRGLLVVELADLVEERGRVLVAGPQALEVEDAQAAQLAQLDRGRRAHDPVHGGAHHGQVEAVGVDLPRDVDVLGVAGPPARDDRDVVEPVGPPSRLEDPDLDLSHCSPSGIRGAGTAHEPRRHVLRLNCERRADTPTNPHPTLRRARFPGSPPELAESSGVAAARAPEPFRRDGRPACPAQPDSSSCRPDSAVAVAPGHARPAGAPGRRAGRRGASPVGWKIGFNTPAIQAHFGLREPVVGYLVDTGVTADGATVSARAGPRRASRSRSPSGWDPTAGSAGLAPASSWSTSACPSTTSRPALAGNICQRGVVFGDGGARRRPLGGGGDGDPEWPGAVVAEGRTRRGPRHDRRLRPLFLAAHGATLVPGAPHHRRLSCVAPVCVAPGDRIDVTFGPLGHLSSASAPDVHRGGRLRRAWASSDPTIRPVRTTLSNS